MEIIKAFQQRFGGNPLAVSSPGRINVIGEHTDYNDGFVLPAAIDRRILMAIAPNQSESHCRFYAADLEESFEIDLGQLRPQQEKAWANYILGVAAELLEDGASFKGFDCLFKGTIPIGGGLSSSAALENATAVGLNAIFRLQRDRQRLLHLSQQAEHRYAGVQCGIMDQFATMMGKTGKAILLDCRTLDYELVPLDLGTYSFVLCDTNVSHSLAASEYNTRRNECEQAVERLQRSLPQITSLRDVSPAQLEAERDLLDPVLYKRAEHVIMENERVQLAVSALKGGKLEILGELLYQSHDSLEHNYEVSCKELDFLVDHTRNQSHVLGARMMGGGFGGCTLNIVETSKVDAFVDEMSNAYRQKMNREMKHYVVRTGDGTKVVS